MLDTAGDTAVSKEERCFLYQIIVKSGSNYFSECFRACFEQGTVMLGKEHEKPEGTASAKALRWE